MNEYVLQKCKPNMGKEERDYTGWYGGADPIESLIFTWYWEKEVSGGAESYRGSPVPRGKKEKRGNNKGKHKAGLLDKPLTQEDMARQNFVGMVVSQGKMQKTVKVRVETKVFNKRINKEMLHRKDYLVHDEGEISREGDLVRIEATRPLSKRKFFAIAEILRNKGQQFAQFEKEAKLNVAREEELKSREFLARRELLEKTNYGVGSTLLNDIRKIQEALNKGESPEELSEIKARYGIVEFTKDTLKQLMKLNVSELEEKVIAQRSKIDGIQSKLDELLKDNAKSNEFLLSHGVENPQDLKRNIKKNMLRKHLLQEAQIWEQPHLLSE